MRYSVGVDLGTAFTAAAVGDESGTRFARIARDFVVPSVVYRAHDGTLLTGNAAVAAATSPAEIVSGFKRRLGDPTPILVGGAAYTPSALMAAQLRDVLGTIAEELGSDPETVTLTHPAVWGPYRLEQFAEVANLAGVRADQLVTEPVATATHFIRDRALGRGQVVAVYDLGGGTLDATVLRMGSRGLEILGTPEGVDHLGGMDFDDAIFQLVDERLDGALSALDPRRPDQAAVLAAARRSCTRAKEQLSRAEATSFPVGLPTSDRQVSIARREFEELIRPSVALSIQALRRSITSAGVAESEVSGILLAGGSARIPFVQQEIAALGPPVQIAHHPKLTVAMGAAEGARARLDRAGGAASRSAEVGATGGIELPTAVAAARAPHEGSAPAPFVERLLRPLRHAVQWARTNVALSLAIVAVLVAAASLLTLAVRSLPNASPGAGATLSTAPGPRADTMYAQRPENGLRAFVQSPSDGAGGDWTFSEVTTTTVSRPNIEGTQAPDGLRVRWVGTGMAQVYLQTPEGTLPLQLEDIAAADGALVFDATVHAGRARDLTVSAHCIFPCGGSAGMTDEFNRLVPEQRTKMVVPIACLRPEGDSPALDASRVNSPFVVYDDGDLDVTFENIRWEAGAAHDPVALDCASG